MNRTFHSVSLFVLLGLLVSGLSIQARPFTNLKGQVIEAEFESSRDSATGLTASQVSCRKPKTAAIRNSSIASSSSMVAMGIAASREEKEITSSQHGGEKSPNAGRTEDAADKTSGMEVEKFEMPDTGHTFATVGRDKVKKWLDEVVIPTTLSQTP